MGSQVQRGQTMQKTHTGTIGRGESRMRRGWKRRMRKRKGKQRRRGKRKRRKGLGRRRRRTRAKAIKIRAPPG